MTGIYLDGFEHGLEDIEVYNNWISYFYDWEDTDGTTLDGAGIRIAHGVVR